MKKTLTFLILFISIVTFSQNKEKTNFKNRLSVKIGTEYRITPIRKVIDNFHEVNPTNIFFNLDKNLSGTSFNYDISYEFIKNLHFGFSHSIRYDHVYFERKNYQLEPNNVNYFTVNDSKSKLIYDYHFYLRKDFKIKNKTIYIKLGYSIMNRGTDYSISEVVATNNDGSIGAIIVGDYDLTFFAINTEIGLVYKNFDFGIGAYFINGSGSNLGSEQNIILPYFKISYRIY